MPDTNARSAATPIATPSRMRSSTSTLQSQIDHNASLIAALDAEIDLINASLALKQNIMDGVCPPGSAIREITPDGSVVCEPDDGGGAGTLETVLTYGSVYLGYSGTSGCATVVVVEVRPGLGSSQALDDRPLSRGPLELDHKRCGPVLLLFP